MTNLKPIHEVIKYSPRADVVAAEWTGAKIADAKPQAKRPTFGKKASR